MNNKEYLAKILPHKNQMILIDDVVDYSVDDRWLESTVTITKDSLFFDEDINGISSLIGIEYMAQTIGCYAFYRKNYTEPHIGFLLGTRLYNNLLDKFNLGETYNIKVHEIFFDNELSSFECWIYDEQRVEVASATINTYLDDNMEKELKNV